MFSAQTEANMMTLDREIELVLNARALIGESPVWADGVLFWIDVKAPSLHRTDLASKVTETWALPSEIGGYALMSAGALVALRSGIFALHFESAKLEQICEPPFDPSTHRFNESGCDPSGRLWLGTMFDPVPGVRADPKADHLYSFTFAGGLVQHDDRSLLHNGFAWSAGGSEFFLAHSREGRIYACEFDPSRGELGERRVFAEVPGELGVPDGAAFDEEGYYWIAIHGGGRLHRYAPDGRLAEVIELPIKNPTKMAFCGADLSDLCITSATHGKPGMPHEGGLFRLRPGVRGIPCQSYINA